MRRDNDHAVSSLRARRAPGAEPRTHYQYLLDLDPELGGELDMRMRMVARPAVTAATVVLEPGELELERWLATAAGGPGLLILGGALVGYARVCDRVVAELLGRGHVVRAGGDLSEDRDEFVRPDLAWRVLSSCPVAILDAAFAERTRAWPQVGGALLRRVERRARDMAVARAINAQPRLELRIVLMLWHLAPRWGRVERGGIRVSLPLTHQLLGRLVGAERPSVTHALKRLAAAGVLGFEDDGLHLRGTFEEHLGLLAEERVEELLRPRAGRGAA